MNPKRYSQIDRALQILDRSANVDILKDDPYLLFLFKKTERIVAALYVLTGLFPDAEPLKWSLRESAVVLSKHTLSFKERSTVHSREFLSDTFAELAHLISLIDIAHIADLLSPMNFTVLKKELETLEASMEGKWKVPGSALVDESFFGISKEHFLERKNEVPSSAFAAREEGLRLFSELERLKRSQKDTFKGHENRENVLYKNAESESSKPSVPTVRNTPISPPMVDHTKEERKRRILDVLRDKSSAMIKDFSSVITDCSEKTIQRLLIEMVQGGVLKREGDRRWSRYSIVSKE